MKYKDYYAILGVERDATAAAIKGAYRKLAHKYHPDVSKDPAGEEKFKELADAYQTLKDPDKRTAYDRLGRHGAGQEFEPPPDWGAQFGANGAAGMHGFDEADLADLFAGLAGGRQRGGRARADTPVDGRDYDIAAAITIEDAFHGSEVELNLSVPDHDARGRVSRVERAFKARIPKGATAGQRLRLRGQGGRGVNGGRDGDLYLDISLKAHRLYRVSGHDLELDLPVSPWEAALGAVVRAPTLEGAVDLKVPAGAQGGQKLRLAGRGLPRPHGGRGDLFALLRIVMPATLSERQRALLKDLGEAAAFNPRAHFPQETDHAH
jgi:curved DNA-binding protein